MELTRIFVWVCMTVTLSWNPVAPAYTNSTNIFTTTLAPYRQQIREWVNFVARDDRNVGLLEDYFGCGLCTALVNSLSSIIDKYPQPELEEMVIAACKRLDLAPKPEICDPMIHAYADQFLYLLKNAPGRVTNICGILNNDCGQTDSSLVNWRIDIDSNKPEFTERPSIPQGVSTVKILQFTDIHLDLDYVEGTTNDCGDGMPICCREYYGYPESPSKMAGKFGDFNCALPSAALEGVLYSAKAMYPDAKYLFLTGDYIHSGVWLYNVTENTRHIKAVTDMIIKVFNGTGIKIFPLTGNHEAHVINMYTPVGLWDLPGFDLSWLYRTVMDPFVEYDPTLIPPKQVENFKKYGYYSVSPEPGLRILAMNSNLCYTENFWLAYYPQDPNGQLQWLSDQLWLAEKAGENVFIIGHVQPGSCWSVWSGKFDSIVTRYEGIIRGQFYGHQHRPQYRLSFDKGTGRPTTTSFIAGSVLTSSMNPAYAVYHVDGDRNAENTWDVVKQELFVLNIGLSNQIGEAAIVKQADSRDTFGMENLRPESVFEMAKRMICDQELLNQYLAFHTKGSDSQAAYHCSIDDVDCLTSTVCMILSSDASDPGPCERMKMMIKTADCSSERGDSNSAGYIRSDGRVPLFFVLALVPFIYKL